MNDQTVITIEEAHSQIAKSSNGLVWQNLEKKHRTPEEDSEMLTAAHTSLFHWLKIGTHAHAQRGNWLLARVYTVLGEPRLAMKYANLCLELTNQFKDEMQDFDIAYAFEAIARSNALAGNLEQARSYYEMSMKAGEVLSSPEDIKIFMKDLRGGKWYGLQ